MKQILKFYKVRRKSDGLFSCGGQGEKFNMTGKTWNNIGHVKNYLWQIIPYYFRYRENVPTEEKQQYITKLQDLEVLEFIYEMSPLSENVVQLDYVRAVNGGEF
jgi:hypothetical protein